MVAERAAAAPVVAATEREPSAALRAAPRAVHVVAPWVAVLGAVVARVAAAGRAAALAVASVAAGMLVVVAAEEAHTGGGIARRSDRLSVPAGHVAR